ncbi:unnamed protein product, partial [Urochloa humidicola]
LLSPPAPSPPSSSPPHVDSGGRGEARGKTRWSGRGAGAGRRPALMCRVLSSPARSTCCSPRGHPHPSPLFSASKTGGRCWARSSLFSSPSLPRPRARRTRRRRPGRGGEVAAPAPAPASPPQTPRVSAALRGHLRRRGASAPPRPATPQEWWPPRWPQRRGCPFARWFGGAGPWHPSHGVLRHVLQRVQAA